MGCFQSQRGRNVIWAGKLVSRGEKTSTAESKVLSGLAVGC